MIVSASYKTDIPAFYGGWFMNRLDAGYCRMVNPYGGQVYTIPLTLEAVDGFVFWTKNLGPFLENLEEVRRRGFPFVVQYAINNYPRLLEQSVTNAEQAVAEMRKLRDYSPFCPVWRYDPVLFTSHTPPAFHLQNFENIAKSLSNVTDEVVVSFAHVYAKTRRNLTAAARKYSFAWRDPKAGEKREMASRLSEIAAKYGIRLTLCAQPEFLVPGAGAARCIDAERLSKVAGRPIAAREKGNREGCRCSQSRDIGEYDTCPHGCVYCYAVGSRGRARRRFREHDPAGEFLFPPGPGGAGPGGGSDAAQRA